MKVTKDFDATAIFREKIEPLLDQAHALAMQHGVALSTFVTIKREMTDAGDQYTHSASCEAEQTFLVHHDSDLLFLGLLHQQLRTAGEGSIVLEQPHRLPSMVMDSINELAALYRQLLENKELSLNEH